MINNYTKCGNCQHEKVCQFKINVNEIITKMNGHLDNISYPKEIFDFTFKCKEYKENEESIKRNPWA